MGFVKVFLTKDLALDEMKGVEASGKNSRRKSQRQILRNREHLHAHGLLTFGWKPLGRERQVPMPRLNL